MIYPSIDKLLNIVDSKYALVHIVSRRARQMYEDGFYQMKERDMFSLAMTDAKASLFTKEAFNKVKRNNRLSRLSHEFAFKI